MDSTFIDELSRHLLVSSKKKQAIIDELQDHLDTYNEDSALAGTNESSSLENIFGSPFALAQQFNKSHIPLYSWVFSPLVSGLSIIALFIIIRCIGMYFSIYVESLYQSGVLLYEFASFLYGVLFLLAVLFGKMKPDTILKGRVMLFLVVVVQACSITFFWKNGVEITGKLLLMELTKSTLYFLLLPPLIPEVRSIVQRLWLRFFV